MTTSLASEATRPRPLRLVFFGESIVSDWGNPAATTMRAILRSLTRLGHHAVYLEERGNRATVELLRARGAGPLLTFSERCPDVQYRTYVLPDGVERAVWLGRELSVADAVVVLDDAPLGVVEAISQAAATHLVKVAAATHAGSAPFPADLELTPVGFGDHPHLGPAVELSAPDDTTDRSELLVVAYDNTSLAHAVAAALTPLSPLLLAPGPVEDANWQAVPEVELPTWYARARVAVVVEPGRVPLAGARLLLPLASGCPVLVASTATHAPAPWLALVHPITPAAALDEVQRLIERDPAPVTVVPAAFHATHQAAQLVNQIDATRIARKARLA